MEKDFSSVSPSAQALLYMKGETDIPFAKKAAALLPGDGVLDPARELYG